MEKESENRSEATIDASSVQLPKIDAIADVLKTRDWLDGQNYDLAVALKAGNFSLKDGAQAGQNEMPKMTLICFEQKVSPSPQNNKQTNKKPTTTRLSMSDQHC